MVYVSSPEYVKQWDNRIKEWQKSGLKISLWCRINKIKLPTFYYWHKRLRKEAAPQDDKPKRSFIELTDSSNVQNEESGVTIQLAGISLQISKQFDEQVLIRCLDIVRRFAC